METDIPKDLYAFLAQLNQDEIRCMQRLFALLSERGLGDTIQALEALERLRTGKTVAIIGKGSGQWAPGKGELADRDPSAG